MNTLSEEQTEFVINVMRERGLKIVEIKVVGKTNKGDNYLGVVQFLTVTYIEENQDRVNSDNKTTDLVLKTPQTSKKFRELAPIRKMYLREIHLYETVIPEFMIFQNEKSILNPFTGVARLYGAQTLENDEALLLENLKQSGYSLWNRKLPMNGDHVALIFREYAKLHSTSLAMRHLEPEKYKKLTEDLGNVFEGTTTEEQVSGMAGGMLELAFAALGDKNDRAKRGLEKFTNEISEFMVEEMRNPDDKLVVVHGDCWCNNLMFKYEDNNNPTKPTKVCLLDWQLSNKASPVCDLSYFFLSSASMGVLKETPKYLKIYHETVTENLRNFGCDPEEVFPYELLQGHWKKFARYGFYMSLLITKVLLNDSEDAVDFAEKADEGKSMLDAFGEKSTNVEFLEAYNSRICDLIIYMADSNLF